ncbi:MAG: hypothetical protein ACE5G2_10020, partial [Candidatus Krumholzibacteriia bacterium]
MSSATELKTGDAELMRRFRQWEELLTLIVDPAAPSVRDHERGKRLLAALLRRAGIPERGFWSWSPARRSRAFLGRYSCASRGLPELEISSFDLDRVAKERFRTEPLTIGAAWHHDYWRSYFSHAAITHPANDGLREEFSTAWDLLRREPALVYHDGDEAHVLDLPSERLDLPMLVGPLPHSDGITMERAYLDAIARTDPEHDLRTSTRVIVESATYHLHESEYRSELQHLLVRIPAEELVPNEVARETGGWALVGELADTSRMIEIQVSASLEVGALQQVLGRLQEEHPQLIVSVYLRYGDRFWKHLYAAAHAPCVAMLHIHAAAEKSYRLIPAVDALLKSARLRSRVQLVTAGGDTDAVSSASAIYEAVLLGANGGSATHLAELALSGDFADVSKGADPRPVVEAVAARDPKENADLASSTLTCWQHSILDFLSCMGIDDVQKTSGNAMAITMTADWLREVDALATLEFGLRNRDINQRRLAAEPIPESVRNDFRVSRLGTEVVPDLDLVLAARVRAHRNA